MIESSGFPLPAVIGGLILFIFLWRKYFPSEKLGPLLILSGAALNLIDRLPDGKVTDYINLGIAIVNLADIAIYVGVFYLIILWSKKFVLQQ